MSLVFAALLAATSGLAHEPAQDAPLSVCPAVDSAAAVGANEAAPLRAGLTAPEDFSDAVFTWSGLPGWTFINVSFGSRDGQLAFATYLAITPEGVASFHDNTEQMEWLVEDSLHLPRPLLVSTQSGSVYLTSFSIYVGPDGKAVLDSMAGQTEQGAPFALNLGSAASPENGICGAPFVGGACNGFFCNAACVPDLPDADPCDCSGDGWCTDGGAVIVCPVGSCTRACVFSVVAGVPTCVCINCGGSAVNYCTAKVNSAGCLPETAFSGPASASAPHQFVVHAQLLLDNKFGVMIFGFSPSNMPFQGGNLCISNPIFRLGPFNTGATGGPPCSGQMSVTLQMMMSHPTGGPQVFPGQMVHVQGWSRDPQDPFGTSLTDAVRFQVCP